MARVLKRSHSFTCTRL